MEEDGYLMLSGLQHFRFCRRQWALIHIEQQWAENLRTVEGNLLHEKAHGKEIRESRGDLIVTRGMNVSSHALGVSGVCDVVEFHRGAEGVSLQGREGLWSVFPVEYKRGKAKSDQSDELQLCAQAMCLEDMLCCEIPEGALYYGEVRCRHPVAFTPELRQTVRDSLAEMHMLYDRGYTPKVKPTKACNACSLKELCLPDLMRRTSPSDYIRKHMEDEL
jgi:CRISPR-associated exonuclease Cas4